MLRHLRNHANYLVPAGFIDYLKIPVLLLRGIFINLMIVLPYILLAAIFATLYWGAGIAKLLDEGILAVTDVAVGAEAGAARLIVTERKSGVKFESLETLLGEFNATESVVISGLPSGTRLLATRAEILDDGRWLLYQAAEGVRRVDLPKKSPDRFQVTIRRAPPELGASGKLPVTIWTDRFQVSKWVAFGLLAAFALYPLAQALAGSRRAPSWRSRDRAMRNLGLLFAVT